MDCAADILFGRQGFAMGDLPHTFEIVGPGILNGPIKQHGRGRDRRKDPACGDRKNIPTRCRFKKHVPSPKNYAATVARVTGACATVDDRAGG